MPRTDDLPPFDRLRPQAFFAANPCFSYEEFARAYVEDGHSRSSVDDVLAYWVKVAVLMRVRRGVYVVSRLEFDPLLLPSKLHPDAVLAYDSAADFHRLCPVEHSCCFLAPRAVPRLHYGEIIFRGLRDPFVAELSTRMTSMISEEERGGHKIWVTSFERTLVDCLARPQFAMNLEQIFASFLRMNRPLDLQALRQRVEEVASPLGCARLGLLLSAHRRYQGQHELLEWLRERIQSQPSYAMEDRRPGGEYVAQWRLTVPRSMSRLLSG